MTFKYFAKKYLIFLICSFFFMSEWVGAKSQATDTRIGLSWDTIERDSPLKDASLGIKLEIPFNTGFRGVNILPASVTLIVKKNEIDLASVAQGIDLVTRSLHDNLPQFDAFFSHIRSRKENLCKDNTYFRNFPICDNEQLTRKFNTSLNLFRNDIEARVSDRILYPYEYNLDKPYAQDFFNRAINLLDTDCPQTCSNTDIAKAIRFSSEEEYQQLYDKIKNKDQNCQKSILEAFAKSLTNEEFPKACQDTKNKDQLVCKKMSKDIETISSRFKELVDLTYGLEASQTTEAQAYCLECELQSSNIRSLNDFLDILDKGNKCLDLNSEEEKTIYSSTGLKPYTVKKEADGSYSISLTMQFSSAEDYNGLIPSNQVPDHYMQKAQECLQQAPQKMVGPENEKLRVIINSPIDNPSICEANAINYILIGSSSERANNKKYGSDIDCPSITYQILRLLGLHNEPIEQQSIGFHVQAKTGNITAALEVNPHQVEALQKKDHKIQLDDNCHITLSKNIESDQKR